MDQLTLRLAGDSGDGIQLIGEALAFLAAQSNYDVKTWPDYPAEIRAPAGTRAGVSGFQITYANKQLNCSSDQADLLLAMNPSALIMHLTDLSAGGTLLINDNQFTSRDYKKAKLDADPINNIDTDNFKLLRAPATQLTINAITELENSLSHRYEKRCKNMFMLGSLCWLCEFDLKIAERWLKNKFANNKANDLIMANIAALKAGFNFAETAEWGVQFPIKTMASKSNNKSNDESNNRSDIGTTTQHITGNNAFAKACFDLSTEYKHNLLLAGYPITPASTLLQTVAAQQDQNQNLQIFQAEDEIAAASAAIGAAYGGSFAVTCTSGPGFDLKTEALGLAVMSELPLVVIDVQRAGPSTGMPTKVEQSDLNAAIYGRHGDTPIPVLAPATPAECYQILWQAMHMAVQYKTPVIVLSDAMLASSAEPWHADKAKQDSKDLADFSELLKNWRTPGIKDKEFMLGGLETDIKSDEVSYDPQNHAAKTKARLDKMQTIAADYASLKIIGANAADTLLITWGSNHGVCKAVVEQLHQQSISISLLTCRNLFPIHPELLNIINSNKFKQIIVVELNTGQYADFLQAQRDSRCKLACEIKRINKVTGQLMLMAELQEALA